MLWSVVSCWISSTESERQPSLCSCFLPSIPLTSLRFALCMCFYIFLQSHRMLTIHRISFHIPIVSNAWTLLLERSWTRAAFKRSRSDKRTTSGDLYLHLNWWPRNASPYRRGNHRHRSWRYHSLSQQLPEIGDRTNPQRWSTVQWLFRWKFSTYTPRYKYTPKDARPSTFGTVTYIVMSDPMHVIKLWY